MIMIHIQDNPNTNENIQGTTSIDIPGEQKNTRGIHHFGTESPDPV